ncbi:papilin [Trichonephila inaurata madagascariensis]|uniref:Papilin n=1 Tax=Trichonephila inaurata madagascariensis TaxID=2747483 RepID=A0A8X6Y358_9ARAC|nr:papilin [Trichonephila inaurata madagascariensis]
MTGLWCLVILSTVAWQGYGNSLESETENRLEHILGQYDEKYGCISDGQYPNYDNCGTFIQCSNRIKTVMPCPKGLHYSEKTQRCEQPCDARCNVTLSCECKWPTCGLKDFCFLPPVTGPCRAEFRNYYFNKFTGKCEKFIYGGCDGNKNNFEKKEDCEKNCGKSDCHSHSDCSSTQECFKNQCQNACKPGKCGMGAECRVFNHEALCRCPPGYTGDPRVHCKKEDEPEFKCGEDGLYPNPDNCSSFIQCSNGIEHVMPCPEDLHFDVKTKRCQQPCEAYCNNTLSCSCKWSTCGLDDVCFLPKEVGICRALIPRVYFNKRTGKCESFRFGGCGGNENNFRTVRECENRCHVHSTSERDSSFSFCGLPASVGPCKEFEVRYHYNMFTDKCETFNYSGCEGNRNNFKTKEACEKECGHQSSGGCHSNNDCSSTEKCFQNQCQYACQLGTCAIGAKCIVINHKPQCRCPPGYTGDPYVRCRKENYDDTCRLPAERGPCEALIPRYFFDYKKGSCEIFVYSGCKGNTNNFETLEECETRCLKKTLNSENTCRLPSKTGPCDGHFPRYFFDHTKGNCEEFIYGGCGGNSNNFKTRQECELRCLMKTSDSEDTCRLPSEKGRCRGHFPRYFFDHTKGNCEEFIYGGCDGNSNNFKTKEECELSCLRNSEVTPITFHPMEDVTIWMEDEDSEIPSERNCTTSIACRCGWPECDQNTEIVDDICKLPSKTGPCKGHFRRYFFDHTKGNCEEFIYGGCEANANNFETVRECENKCLRRTLNSENICRLPSKQGPCRGHFPRYFFDHTKGKCEEFIYGGCEGNPNNFETVTECEQACLRKSEYSEEKPCSEEGKFQDLQSCDSYIECSNGVEKRMTCPRGLHFNEASGECDSPCEARCDPSLASRCGWPMYSDY